MATEFKCYKSLNLCCSCYWPSCLIDDRKMEEQKPKDQRFKANENKPVMNEWVLSEQFAALQGIAANHVTPTMLKPILCYLSCFSWTLCGNGNYWHFCCVICCGMDIIPCCLMAPSLELFHACQLIFPRMCCEALGLFFRMMDLQHRKKLPAFRSHLTTFE
jgi:hypothetical protein